MEQSEKRQHSVSVPRLYKEASKILQRYENKEGTLKNMVFDAKYPNKKNIFGLLKKAVDKGPLIKKTLAACNLFNEVPSFNPHLAHVLTSELLERGLRGECKPIIVLKQYEDKIKELYASYAQENPFQEENRVCNPRYVRINTLVTSAEEVHTQLEQEMWTFIEYSPEEVTYEDFLNYIDMLGDSSYMQDYHIPELLVFPPNTPLWDSKLYKTSSIILQDKASCLPVFLSNIKPGDNIIDGCAAPGNKTSYMAAVINNDGSIVATDRSSKRYYSMIQLLDQRGATCVTALQRDFTDLTPDRYSDVQCIFLDPTCSGSGASIHEDTVSEDRIQKLASFQLRLLLHALSFPSVQEVIYSTCSVNVEENERVVEEALKICQDHFELEEISKKLPGWKHFGDEGCCFSQKVLRTNPDVDRCQGFFVSKFVRKLKHETEIEHFNPEKSKGKKRKSKSDKSKDTEKKSRISDVD